MANLSNINNKFIVESDGDVGIGVTTALDKLNVGDGNIRISQVGNVASQLILNTYQSALGNTTYKWFVGQTTSANSYSFQIGNGTTPYLHINSLLFGAAAGNVGIGTTTPDAILNISKTSFSTTFTSADSYIRIGKGENATNGYQFIGFGYNNGSADLVPAYIGYQQTGTPGNYTKGDLVFGTRNVTTNTAPTERMRIDSAGDTTFAGSVTASDTSKIEKAQITTQFDTSSFLRLHPSATTDSGGYTNMIFGTSTVNNYGVAIGGLRAGTDGTPSFSIRMLNDSITGTEVLRIASNGLITIDSSIVLDNNEGLFWGATSGTNEYIVSNGADLQLGTGGTERMRITSAGEVLIGGTVSGELNSITMNGGGGYIFARSTGASAYFDKTSSDGAVVVFRREAVEVGTISVAASSTAYNTSSSDKRLKKNITNWNENILDKFKDIKPKEFNFNNQDDSEEKIKGYIAQNEVDKFPEAYPLLYNEKAGEDRHQFNPSGMVVYLMKAIQELEARVKELENK
jgi:hypothetical protein